MHFDAWIRFVRFDVGSAMYQAYMDNIWVRPTVSIRGSSGFKTIRYIHQAFSICFKLTWIQIEMLLRVMPGSRLLQCSTAVLKTLIKIKNLAVP